MSAPGVRPRGLRSRLFLKVHRVREMVRKELRQLFRDPRTKRVIFASPVVQLLAFGYAVNTDVREIPLHVQDLDRTQVSRNLIATLDASDFFRVQDQSRRPEALTRALDRGRATLGLVVPVGFARDLAAGRTPAVQVLVDGSDSNTGVVAQGYAQRMILSFAMDHARAGSAAPPEPIDLRVRAWFNANLESRAYNVPGVIGMIVMIMSMLLTSLSVAREREVGTLDQLVVSPLTPGELMLGKTLPVTAIAIGQMALVTAVALLWFDVPFRGSALTVLVGAALFIVAGLAIGLLISTVSRTQQEAFLGLFLVIFPIVILSGFLYPVDTMPDFFQSVSLLNPLRHFLEIVRSVFLKGAGFADLWVQFLALSLMASGGLALAADRFRRSLN